MASERVLTNGVEEFKEQYPSLESYWRSIILFGCNVASYKFALAKSLLDIAPIGKTVITLDELVKQYITSDARPGREGEKFLNVFLRKTIE